MCFRMAHSKDLRARVCAYVRGGGSKAEAARIFSVGRSQVYAWHGRERDGKEAWAERATQAAS